MLLHRVFFHMIPMVPQRNTVSGEDVCWYKEEFKLLISFKIYHCPIFHIALQKICSSPRSVLWRVRDNSLGSTIIFITDYLIFYIIIISDIFTLKNKLVTQSDSCQFKLTFYRSRLRIQLRYHCQKQCGLILSQYLPPGSTNPNLIHHKSKNIFYSLSTAELQMFHGT